MRVENINGKANQFIIKGDDGTQVFQSYSTPIARKSPTGEVTLAPDWENTATTNRYRCIFLGEKAPVTRAKIADGTYKVAVL